MLHELPQVVGNPCFLDYRYSPAWLRYHSIGYGRRLLNTGTGQIQMMVLLGVGRRRLKWIFFVLVIAFYNKKKCCLVSKINCVYALDSVVIHIWILFWCITNHFLIWYKVCFIKMLYLYTTMYVRIEWFLGLKDIWTCRGSEPYRIYPNEGHPSMVTLT